MQQPLFKAYVTINTSNISHVFLLLSNSVLCDLEWLVCGCGCLCLGSKEEKGKGNVLSAPTIPEWTQTSGQVCRCLQNKAVCTTAWGTITSAEICKGLPKLFPPSLPQYAMLRKESRHFHMHRTGYIICEAHYKTKMCHSLFINHYEFQIVTAKGKNPPGIEGNTRDAGSIPELGGSPGEEKGYLLQYSSLENPTDRGAWQATVHGVAQSQTWLVTGHISAQRVLNHFWSLSTFAIPYDCPSQPCMWGTVFPK